MPTKSNAPEVPRHIVLRILVLVAALLYAIGVFAATPAGASSEMVYFGTYTGQKSKGIYLARLDAGTGQLGSPELVAETPNPSFLALHPSGRFLYAANEIENFQGRRQGGVSAFAIDPGTGRLSLLNQQPSGGSGPCHLATDKSGGGLLVANYGSGSVAALPIASDGRLGMPCAAIQHHGSSVNPQRQEGPHAHFITPDPDNRFALVCDLGLDKVLLYRLDPAHDWLGPDTPISTSVHPGAGPRHLAFGANGRFVYVINEMGSDLTAFSYDSSSGKLLEVQTTSTLPAGYRGNSTCAEVQVGRAGKFLYASNRGHNSIAVFAIDPATGKLTLQQHESTQGKTPRHFSLDLTGRWLLAENQDSDDVVIFKVQSRDGRLQPTGQTVAVGAPTCSVFLAEEH